MRSVRERAGARLGGRGAATAMPTAARRIAAEAAPALPYLVTRDLDGDARRAARPRPRAAPGRAGAPRPARGGCGPKGSACRTAREVPDWFLSRWPDIRGSDALETFATEYDCQGLELDVVGLAWGGDFVRRGGPGLPRGFVGDALADRRGARTACFIRNTYRVLLTRARYETIIWVPRGSAAADPFHDTHPPSRRDGRDRRLPARLRRPPARRTHALAGPAAGATRALRRCLTPPLPTPALLQAVADLHRAAFTGLVLATVARRGTPAAAELVFAVFRRQHHERFLPGLQKLGLTALPHAVAAAQYHYLSNRIGGVSVEYMPESDRKAWIRYAPPRWLWHGTAICGIPGEVSRAMLRGWHAHNGVSLGNPRLGFVCTGQVADGDAALEGYYLRTRPRPGAGGAAALRPRRGGAALRSRHRALGRGQRLAGGARCARRTAPTRWSTCAPRSPPRSTCSARPRRRRCSAWRCARSACSGTRNWPRLPASPAAAPPISPRCWPRSPPRRATA